MQKYIEQRVIDETNHILQTLDTVRETASVFGVSKSTVHKDLQERLLEVDPLLYKKILKIFEEHNKTRHIKGGAATKAKYSKV